MSTASITFVPVRRSLADLCGAGYVEAVCRARAALTGEALEPLLRRAMEAVEFYPEAFEARGRALLDRVGETIIPGLAVSAAGASTGAFNGATKTGMAPLSGLAYFRVGEDGRLYLTTKSEHYHASLGHGFPGYGLIETAKRLGIPNATHNNTRGHITRLLEEELVAAANGISAGDSAAMAAVLSSDRLDVLNRVLNLETGSLAVEAALKMILARFYRMQQGLDDPRYRGKTPVILVMGDHDGNVAGNYHGTTVLTQVMRGMWGDLATKLDASGAFQVRAIRPNCLEDLESIFQGNGAGDTRIAGFFHEIVMMNYGGILLTPEFLHRAYDLCHANDVPVVCDEIQSCVWSSEEFLFREYGLKPSFVSAGKGFPGGEYPASRIVFSAAMDNQLPQFGALVTNGQEELASLAYLVTLKWVQANGAVINQVGEYYAGRLREVAGRFDGLVTGIEGKGHMSSIMVADLASAKAIAALLVEAGLDISVQAYKADCPPALLSKLPLIAGCEVVDCVVGKVEAALAAFSGSKATLAVGQ